MNDGSQLLADLWQWQSNATLSVEWKRFKRQLITRLNLIFESVAIPKVSDLEMKGPNQASAFGRSGLPSMQLSLETSPEFPIELDDMGSGISQMVIILS